MLPIASVRNDQNVWPLGIVCFFTVPWLECDLLSYCWVETSSFRVKVHTLLASNGNKRFLHFPLSTSTVTVQHLVLIHHFFCSSSSMSSLSSSSIMIIFFFSSVERWEKDKHTHTPLKTHTHTHTHTTEQKKGKGRYCLGPKAKLRSFLVLSPLYHCHEVVT